MRQAEQNSTKKKTRQRQLRPNQRPKINLAHGPDLSNAALEQLAEVTPADVNHATALWKSKTSLSGLLNAKVEEQK